MPRAKLDLHSRDLLAASSDSRRNLPSFFADLLERTPVALKCGLLP
jgi:hypothetical protein